MLELSMHKKNKKETNLLHIYNRGNRKQNICEDIEDYSFLHNLMKDAFQENHFDLLGFCIMTNHYHLLAKNRGPNSIGKVMQIIGAGYAKYFNVKYSLSGHLFQGTYKYKFVTNALQLKTLSDYIKANLDSVNLPIKYPFYFLNTTLIDHYLLTFMDSYHNQEIL